MSGEVKTPTMRRLTKADKERIEAVEEYIPAFVEAWKVVLEAHGQNFDEMETIVSWDYVMYEEDWKWVAESLHRRFSDPVAGVSAMLDWMNRGPSAT